MWWHPIGMQSLTRADVFESYGVELTRFATSLVGPAEAQDVVSEGSVPLSGVNEVVPLSGC